MGGGFVNGSGYGEDPPLAYKSPTRSCSRTKAPELERRQFWATLERC